MAAVAQVHRRKRSKDEDEDSVIGLNDSVQHSQSPPPEPNGVNSIDNEQSSRRLRVNSTPKQLYNEGSNSSNLAPLPSPGPPLLPPSAGPHRTSFTFPRAPGQNGINGYGHYPASPLRSTFGPNSSGGHVAHSRNRSISAGFPASASLPSPLSSTFPPQSSSPPSSNGFRFPPSNSISEVATNGINGASTESTKLAQASQNRRHARIHSRNLSVFFPRPGAMPTPSIAEDGSQEIEMPSEEAPIIDIPPADKTPLGAGFKFGSQPPPSASSATYNSLPPLPTPMSATSRSGGTSRRGHHHKHSVSHNFFSFLEPGAQQHPSAGILDGSRPATPASASPWNTVDNVSIGSSHANGHPQVLHSPKSAVRIAPASVMMASGQFLLGAWLWVAGQQRGSLSSTGLGYWVVFDALGVGVGQLLPAWLAKSGMQNKYRRPYGNARVETLSMFAQAIYLMFASVYICKETVEHVLLSSGGEDAHGHHHEDEGSIEFPLLPIFAALLTLFISASLFGNHSKLIDTTDNRIPSLRTLIRSILSPSSSASSKLSSSPSPTTLLGMMLTNPYISSPLVFCLAILGIVFFASPTQHQSLDLTLAGIITVITFKVSYRASVILGAVLLQTSPRRGHSGGKMESFLRAMREVERHPQILHLPAPHMWQLTSLSSGDGQASRGGLGGLVVTLELHVREDTGDDDALKLTRWAWEKCEAALRGGSIGEKQGEWEEGAERDVAEVTVGIVRG